MNIELDNRIEQILKIVLNTKCRYSSVTVSFINGEQSVDTVYLAPTYDTGHHLFSSGRKPIDEVLSAVKSLKDKGEIETLISELEKKKRENLTRISELKSLAKDIDLSLTKLLRAK